MPDRSHPDVQPSDTALAAALRALPESAPAPDLWPELAGALARRRRRQRWARALPVAIAAGVAIAMLVPRLSTRDAGRHAGDAPASLASAPEAAPTRNDDELAALRRRSRTLEDWLAAVAHAPQDGRDLMAAVEVEDLIGLVDVQLTGARGDADALPLWRQRVALLEDLAAIRGNGLALAGDDAGAVPASLHLLN
jgi:hypothetical protein